MAARRWALLGARYSDFDLQLQWYRNYDATAFDSNTITSDRILAAPIMQFSEVNPVQDGESLRLVVTDATPTNGGSVGTGRGGAFIGLAVEVDPIDGKIYKMAAQERS
jgi:hypothetical protein